jgi:hypothetical protein
MHHSDLENLDFDKFFRPTMRTKLQKTTKGEYFIIIPRDMIRLVGWTEGEEIEVTPGLEVSPRREDLVLRKT